LVFSYPLNPKLFAIVFPLLSSLSFFLDEKRNNPDSYRDKAVEQILEIHNISGLPNRKLLLHSKMCVGWFVLTGCSWTFLNSVVKHPVGLRPALLGFLRICSKAESAVPGSWDGKS
jgi:hypothetical protein